MDTSSYKAVVGRLGEALATRHLEDHGCAVLSRNVRHGRDELDIIAVHRGRTVIVEVKATSDGSDPLDAVDDSKLECIDHAAHGLGIHGHRIDVVAVRLTPSRAEVRWLQGTY